MLFELHCHSHYSRGKKIPWEGLQSPRRIIRVAKGLGLGGVALTDHSSNRGWAEAHAEAKKCGLIFIPGMEIPSTEGHVIGLGLTEFIKGGLSLDETIDRIHAQGGLAVAVHPFDIRGEGVRHGMAKADVVEIFNALSLDRLSNWFCERTAAKLGMVGIAGSDAHTAAMIGAAPNSIEGDNLDSVLKEIKAGNVYFKKRYLPLHTIMAWTRERLTRSYPAVLRYINANYCSPRAWLARGLLKRFIRSEGWYWSTLARLGLGLSAIYSGLKVLSY